MIRRSPGVPISLLGMLATVTLLAGCGSAATHSAPPATPSTQSVATAAATASVSASASAASSISASLSPAPSESVQPTDALAHVSPTLEDQLPSTMEDVPLVKFSLVLSAFIASPPSGGDKDLYAAWLVNFGETPDDVDIAIAFSASDSMDFNARAIGVPGATAANLSSDFEAVAKKAGWKVTSYANLMATGKNVLEMIDPANTSGPSGGAGYVYARDGVLYEIITNDQSLLQDALIQMP